MVEMNDDGKNTEFKTRKVIKAEGAEMKFYPNRNTGKFTLDFQYKKTESFVNKMLSVLSNS